MKKNEQGITIVNRQELDTILNKMKEKQINKGILLMGPVGVGKTTIMKKHIGSCFSSNYYSTQYMLGGIEAFVNKQGRLMHRIDCIDDLGTEIIPSHFGNKLDLVPYLIQIGYEQSVSFGFYTTNLNYTELKERYGARVIDRLQEKCFFFILEDTSFRKLATAQDINNELNKPTPEPKIDETKAFLDELNDLNI